MRAFDRIREALVALAVALLVVASAAAAGNYTFVSHAAFFSSETQQPKPLDPQIFVKAAAAPAGTGLQGITHVAGVRNALLSDPAGTAALNADGKSLNFTLGAWFAASGTAQVRGKSSGPQTVLLTFAKLVPVGTYSVFENHFGSEGVTFTPLDGTGTKNNVVADAGGHAVVTIVAPQAFSDANAILLVYHSDGKTHGTERGDIGHTAFHQLIMPFASK